MGRPFREFLNGTTIYSCANCRAHSADHDDIISTVRHAIIQQPLLCIYMFWCPGIPRASWASLSVRECVSVNRCIAYGAPLSPRSCRVNISIGPAEDRVLMTGLHTVADIQCTCCSSVLGWKYVSSYHEIVVLFPVRVITSPLACTRSKHLKRARSTRKESSSSNRLRLQSRCASSQH
jgi:Yippee zinc-binding/DNA-binding /Mis18, centromere assembly